MAHVRRSGLDRFPPGVLEKKRVDSFLKPSTLYFFSESRNNPEKRTMNGKSLADFPTFQKGQHSGNAGKAVKMSDFPEVPPEADHIKESFESLPPQEEQPTLPYYLGPLERFVRCIVAVGRGFSLQREKCGHRT